MWALLAPQCTKNRTRSSIALEVMREKTSDMRIAAKRSDASETTLIAGSASRPVRISVGNPSATIPSRTGVVREHKEVWGVYPSRAATPLRATYHKRAASRATPHFLMLPWKWSVPAFPSPEKLQSGSVAPVLSKESRPRSIKGTAVRPRPGSARPASAPRHCVL